jgi:ATP-dependent DNA ligase
MYDPAMTAADTDTKPVASDAIDWRPQGFGKTRAAAIDDPLVEPLWAGVRVLAHVDAGQATLRDLDGDPVDDFPEINAALAGAIRAERVVVDAHLTHQPIQAIAEVAARDSQGAEAPTATAVVGQWWFGSLLRGRRRKVSLDPESVGRDPLPANADIAIVVVDLLSIDDQPLLDVPLLERKRILESILVESEFVRRGIYIRPPIDTWIGSWRTFGFNRMAFKAANSRYLPGRPNPDWAIADLPSR